MLCYHTKCEKITLLNEHVQYAELKSSETGHMDLDRVQKAYGKNLSYHKISIR